MPRRSRPAANAPSLSCGFSGLALSSPQIKGLQNTYRTDRVCSCFVSGPVPCRALSGGDERPMLTRKQFELLRFIHERLKEAGVPPSFDEMKDALDLRSKSGIHRLITALEERGFIRRLPNRARAIEVIKLPDSVAHGIAGTRARGFTPSVIEGNLGRVRSAAEDESGRP